MTTSIRETGMTEILEPSSRSQSWLKKKSKLISTSCHSYIICDFSLTKNIFFQNGLLTKIPIINNFLSVSHSSAIHLYTWESMKRISNSHNRVRGWIIRCPFTPGFRKRQMRPWVAIGSHESIGHFRNAKVQDFSPKIYHGGKIYHHS